MSENRPIILRGNRFLGNVLIEHNLINVEQLEAANERFVEIVKGGKLKSANLLNILIYELKVLDESKLIDLSKADGQVGFIDLGHYNIKDTPDIEIDFDFCWSTFTIPFEFVDGFVMIATSFYLSLPVRKYWEKRFRNRLVWYISSTNSISLALERVAAMG